MCKIGTVVVQILLFLLTCSFLVATTTVVEAESSSSSSSSSSDDDYYNKKPNVVVEAFVANWCAKQFPNQLPTFSGYSMISIMSNHEKIEPWVGQWCFEQFPNDLSTKLDQTEAIQDLYTNHVQLEPFLESWGRKSLATVATAAETPTDHFGSSYKELLLIDIEPYIADWCVEQYPQQLGHLKYMLHENVQTNHVKFEPALARWCFAQFPTDLASLDQDSVLEGIATNHELIEDHLIQWTLTTDSVAGYCLNDRNNKQKTTAVVVVVLSSLLSVSLVALFVLSSMVICRSRHHRSHDSSTGEEDGDAEGVTKIELAEAEIS